LFFVAPAAHEPAFGRFDQHTIGEVPFALLEHGQNGKIVGGLFFSSHDRYLHLRQERTTHLAGRHKEHVADHEFGQGLLLVARDALEAWVACERARLGIDLGLK
jgi:hypothetical protein